MSENNIRLILEKSAKSALFSWRQGSDGAEELVNDLWVWYLESPATQKKLQESDEPLARKLVYEAALQILARNALADDMFEGKGLYSADSVKAALRGESKNHYLVDILPIALKSLEAQNESHAEAIRSRYDDGVVPPQGSHYVLVRAVKSLTQHVNIIVATAGVDARGNSKDGPGSRSAVFPQTRRATGDGHSDPTGNMALQLLESGDEEHILCALVDRQPVRGPGGPFSNFLDSDQTTTIRKEFMR